MTSSPAGIIDAQVHTWLPRDEARYPWDPDTPTSFFETDVPAHPAEQVLEDMDGAGVAAAIAVVPRLYGWDNSYALDAAARFPDRLALVGRLDPVAPEHADRLRAFIDQPGMVGLRLPRSVPEDWAPGGTFSAMLAAAEALTVPICAMPGPTNLSVIADVASRHEGLPLVVDHLGMEAVPQTVPVPGPRPFRYLPDLLALAKHPNVHVKLTGAPALSNEPFPFRDIWEAVLSIIERFGPERVMWGSDYNRVSTLHGYRDGTRYLDRLGLDDATLHQLRRGTAESVFRWSPRGPA